MLCCSKSGRSVRVPVVMDEIWSKKGGHSGFRFGGVWLCGVGLRFTVWGLEGVESRIQVFTEVCALNPKP